MLWRCRGDALPREPPEGGYVPDWLVQCVAHAQYAPRDSVKLSFLLVPHERSRLPELPAGANRLSAPRALKLSRVAAHVARTLSQDGLSLGSAEAVAEGEAHEAAIVLYCGDKPLPPTMSLLTARQFLWRQGGDMVLTFAERLCGQREWG